MKKVITTAFVVAFCSCQLFAQQTVVRVHTTGGAETECVLGESGAIYFTAQGEQIAVKDQTGVVRGFGLGMVEKVTFSEKEPEGIVKPEVRSQISVYPNPATDFVVVRSSGTNIQSVRLFDLQGRCVQSLSQLNADACTLDLRALPKGVYFLRSHGQTLKIVKQ